MSFGKITLKTILQDGHHLFFSILKKCLKKSKLEEFQLKVCSGNDTELWCGKEIGKS